MCMKKLSGGLVAVVTEDNCLPEEKPRGEQQCDTHKCKAEWYTTEWTKVRRLHDFIPFMLKSSSRNCLLEKRCF